MDDLNDPRISAYKPQGRLLLPTPPGYRRKLSKAQRKQKALAETRAEAAWNRPIVAAIPAACYAEIAHAGHVPQYEQPEAFRAALLDWLATT